MQKEVPESSKVRPRTAIERASFLGTAVRMMCTTADDRTVRLRLRTMQAVAATLAGRVERAYGPLPQPWQLMAGRVEVAAWPCARVLARRVCGGAGRLRPILGA